MQVYARCPSSDTLATARLHPDGEEAGCDRRGVALVGRRGCFTTNGIGVRQQRIGEPPETGRVRSAPEGLRGIRAIDLSRRRSVLLALDHKQFPVRHLCEKASVRTGSEIARRGGACTTPGSSGGRARRPDDGAIYHDLASHRRLRRRSHRARARYTFRRCRATAAFERDSDCAMLLLPLRCLLAGARRQGDRRGRCSRRLCGAF